LQLRHPLSEIIENLYFKISPFLRVADLLMRKRELPYKKAERTRKKSEPLSARPKILPLLKMTQSFSTEMDLSKICDIQTRH
jgi:hypothetical protein